MAERIKPSRQSSIKEGLDAAKRLLSKGFSERIVVLQGDVQQYQVPSEYTDGIFYTVCPSECRCTCPYGEQGHYCKHIQLLILLCNSSDPRFTPLEDQMNNLVSRLQKDTKYTVLNQDSFEFKVHSMFDETIHFVALSSNSCTCIAAGYYHECACLKLGRIISSNVNVVYHDNIKMESDEIPSESYDDDTVQALNAHFGDNKQDVLNKIENIKDKIVHATVIEDEIKSMVDILHRAVSSVNFKKKETSRAQKVRKLHPLRKAKRKVRPNCDPKYSPTKELQSLGDKTKIQHDHAYFVKPTETFSDHNYSEISEKSSTSVDSSKPKGKLKAIYKGGVRRKSLKDTMKLNSQLTSNYVFPMESLTKLEDDNVTDCNILGIHYTESQI